jgi:hypothetical protein
VDGRDKPGHDEEGAIRLQQTFDLTPLVTVGAQMTYPSVCEHFREDL